MLRQRLEPLEGTEQSRGETRYSWGQGRNTASATQAFRSKNTNCRIKARYKHLREGCKKAFRVGEKVEVRSGRHSLVAELVSLVEGSSIKSLLTLVPGAIMAGTTTTGTMRGVRVYTGRARWLSAKPLEGASAKQR